MTWQLLPNPPLSMRVPSPPSPPEATARNNRNRSLRPNVSPPHHPVAKTSEVPPVELPASKHVQEIITGLKQENEELKQRVKEQRLTIVKLQSQLTAQITPGRRGISKKLFAEAGSQVLARTAKMAERHAQNDYRRIKCRCVLRHWARSLAQARKKKQIQRGIRGAVKELTCDALMGVMNGVAIERLEMGFFTWTAWLRAKRRLNANPYMEDSAQNHEATGVFLRGVHSLVQSGLCQDETMTHDVVLGLSMDITDAEAGHVFAVDPESGDLYLKSSKGSSERCEGPEDHCPQQWEQDYMKISAQDKGILATTARKRCLYNCPDVLASNLYAPMRDRPPGVVTRNILVYPLLEGDAVYNPQDLLNGEDSETLPSKTDARMYAVVVLVNKAKKMGTQFDSRDVANLNLQLHSCGDIMKTEATVTEQTRRAEQLADLLSIMAVDASDIKLDFLSPKVVELTCSKRGAIFVVDDEAHELYFMVDTKCGGKKQIRMPLSDKSMAGACILSNELINIPDCYQDDRFNPTMDRQTGFRTTQMLCVPVTDASRKPIGAIQVINTDHGMAFTQRDVNMLQRFRVYVQIAILNQQAEQSSSHAAELAKQAISITTSLSWSHSAKDLMRAYFQQIGESTGARYISLTLPTTPENKMLRYDNLHEEPCVVPLQEGTAICEVGKAKFLNVIIQGQGGGRELKSAPVHQHVPRMWVESYNQTARANGNTSLLDTEVRQAAAHEYRLKEQVDFDKDGYGRDLWESLLMVPIVTHTGIFVLTVAGKQSNDRFAVLDEELLFLTGQHFCHMLCHYDLSKQIHGLLDIMTLDASAIDFGFLSDRAVALCNAQRGAIFVIEDNVTEEQQCQQLFFLVDTPEGKKEIRMPLTKKSMAGACILNNEIINIPNCYEDDRFDPAMDRKTGFRTIQMMCVPVVDSQGKGIGAFQVINTDNTLAFTEQHVELLRAFRIYVQIAIINRNKLSARRSLYSKLQQTVVLG